MRAAVSKHAGWTGAAGLHQLSASFKTRAVARSSATVWLVKRAATFLVPEDGVGDGEDLLGHRDEGDHLGLSGGHEAVVERRLNGELPRVAVRGPAVNSTARHGARPPPIMLLPCHWPDWRTHGARPPSAATLRRSRLPSSGISARRTRAVTGPIPGMLVRSFSFLAPGGDPRTMSSMSVRPRTAPSCKAATRRSMLLRSRFVRRAREALPLGPIISTIWRRRDTRSDSSRVCSSGSGRTSGLMASTKRAITTASSRSVLAL